MTPGNPRRLHYDAVGFRTSQRDFVVVKLNRKILIRQAMTYDPHS